MVRFLSQDTKETPNALYLSSSLSPGGASVWQANVGGNLNALVHLSLSCSSHPGFVLTQSILKHQKREESNNVYNNEAHWTYKS